MISSWVTKEPPFIANVEYYDDIDFFGKLRGLTIVKGIQMGPKLEEYLNKMSQKTDIHLYYQISI